jgi:hypothetical protein
MEAQLTETENGLEENKIASTIHLMLFPVANGEAVNSTIEVCFLFCIKIQLMFDMNVRNRRLQSLAQGLGFRV